MTATTHGRSGRPWRELRLRVLAEEPYCYRCGRLSTQVDHIVPLSIAPHLAHERSNLRGSCAPCNARGGALMTNSRRRGYLPPPDPQPPRPCSWTGTGLPCCFTCGGALASVLCRLPRS